MRAPRREPTLGRQPHLTDPASGRPPFSSGESTMATATKKTPTPTSGTPASPSQSRSGILAATDAIYRFLASLKLAVLSLGALAAVLAYATFFESWYGSSAVQEWIYQT